jgi:sensor histidine kinase YesM
VKGFTRLLPGRLLPGRFSLKIILLVFTLVSLSISLACVLFYTRTVTLIRAQSVMYTQNLCRNLSRDIDAYIEEMERVCRIILGNPEIQSIFERRHDSGYSDDQYLRDQELVMNLALSFTSVRDSFIIQLYDENGFAIYADPGHFMSYDQPLFENPWTLRRKESIDERKLFIVPPLYSALMLYTRRPAFYVIRPLRRVSDNRVLGYMTVAADSRHLLDILRRYAQTLPGTEARVCSPDNIVLLSLRDEETGGRRTGPDPNAVFYISSFSSWRTEIVTGQLYGRGEMAETGLFAAFIIVMTAAASLIIAVLVAVYLTRPIQRLAAAMARVGKGDFNISLDEPVDRELRPIFTGFNTMVAEIRHLVQTVHEEKLLAKSAQFEALRYQINPHFLYNALQTIEAIGEVRGVEEVRIMAQSLGRLFRYNTQGVSEVFLYEEIDQIDTQLQVEKIRFGDKISWEFVIPPETRECRILKFILQPLIENAVIHGFRSIARKGFIRVSVELQGQDLAIEVWDNGTGMGEETYRAVSETLILAAKDKAYPAPGSAGGTVRSEASPPRGFVGILNVQRRLVNYYGPRYGLRYERGSGGIGTAALLLLPAVFRPPVSQNGSGDPPPPVECPRGESR